MGPSTLAYLSLATITLINWGLLVEGQNEGSNKRKDYKTAVLDRRAQFDCSVKSTGSAENAAQVEIWWQFQDKNVTSHAISVTKEADGTVLSQLTINRVSWDDGGTYSCLAREIRPGSQVAGGSSENEQVPSKQEVQLDIYAEPTKVSSTDGSGVVESSTQMSCTFQGKPLPVITWIRHGEKLKSDDVKYVVTQDRISHKEIASFLQISNLNHLDNGSYLCSAENELKTDVAIINAVVFDKPFVQLDTVKAVDQDKIYLNWTVVLWNSPITDYLLFYRKTDPEETEWTTYVDERIPGDQDSFVLRGLELDTSYQVKLGAKNKYGQSEFDVYPPDDATSEEKNSVRTLTWSPTAFVPVVGLKGLTWNSISIGWDPPPTLRSGGEGQASSPGGQERNYLEYIHYYKLTRRSNDDTSAVYHSTGDYPFYLWENLEADTKYSFVVSACNGFTRECGSPSRHVEATTEDGLSSQPREVVIDCQMVNSGSSTFSSSSGSKMGYVDVSWEAPRRPNGQIEFYNIKLKGVSTFRNADGVTETDTIVPDIKTFSNKLNGGGGGVSKGESVVRRRMKTRFDFLSPNTVYNVSVCAVTRRKDCGEVSTKSCRMPASPPDLDSMRGFRWSNDQKSGRDIFRLSTPKISERNGPICCMRVVVVRMKPGSTLQDLDPNNMEIGSFRKAHPPPQGSVGWGAYVAEILGPNSLGSDVYVGDGQNILAAASTSESGGGSQCSACHSGVHTHLISTANFVTGNRRYKRNVAAPAELVEDGFLNADSNYTAFVEVIVPQNAVGRSPLMLPRKPGQAVYPPGRPGGETSGGYEGAGEVSTAFICVLGVLAGLVTVALFLLLGLLYLRRYSKQVAASQGNHAGGGGVGGGGHEMDLVRSLRHFLSNGLRLPGSGRDHSQYLITPNGEPGVNNGHHRNGHASATDGGLRGDGEEKWKPAEIGPVNKDDLVSAYLERHKDSDYGFQAEFELLPDRSCLADERTTSVCDRPVNSWKNRYPDIRCYDQTRVKLSPLTTLPQFPPDRSPSPDTSSPISSPSSLSSPSQGGAGAVPTTAGGGVASSGNASAESSDVIDGSDYINANFVPGYKNRKVWICAQGPLERTIADFWRMIYEQGTAIIVMLTNLEEYNRVKCAQYWPGAGDSNYVVSPHCLINVGFCTEKRYSDYIVRDLTMTVRTQKAGEDKATTVVRSVRHYHYLQWKDFNAPEHAPGMLKFIKRINEAHFQGKSHLTHPNSTPIVVHCSAGVGRSGTLIAIDSLIQELREEGHVSIYRLVCELRHSRNYLVQSVKQYIFVYRAIMEMAQFGDTEMESTEIKSVSRRLCGSPSPLSPKGGSSSVSSNSSSEGTGELAQEFAKLANIVDDRKALSVGTNEENACKNQGDTVIPFDRNRVILTPDGLRPHSTYINASFIEGYHNDESFIITQDPMPNTAEDFWRMVTEHKIRTMVQLTEPDGSWLYYPEASTRPEADGGGGLTFSEFGSMRVSLDSVDDSKGGSYVARELTVYNGKADESVRLTHFAFKKWPSGDNKLPDKTQGLLDLVEHATAHKTEMKRSGPIAVHCRLGSDRSSVYVALSCLVQQLKTESRADVFTVVRKLRSQRQGMVQTLPQYRFIYRAISDYVDLYNSRDDEEYQYSVPVNAVNGNGAISSSASVSSKPPNGSIKRSIRT